MSDFSEKPTSVPPAFAADSRDKPVVNYPLEKPVSVPVAAVWSILLAASHGVAWVVALLYLLIFAPRQKQVFEDFKMKLPWLTELVIDLSDFVNEFLIVPLFLLVVFLAVDTAILFVLRRKRALVVLTWPWFILMLLVPIATVVLCWLGMYLPMIDLFEGLSK